MPMPYPSMMAVVATFARMAHIHACTHTYPECCICIDCNEGERGHLQVAIREPKNPCAENHRRHESAHESVCL